MSRRATDFLFEAQGGAFGGATFAALEEQQRIADIAAQRERLTGIAYTLASEDRRRQAEAAAIGGTAFLPRMLATDGLMDRRADDLIGLGLEASERHRKAAEIGQSIQLNFGIGTPDTLESVRKLAEAIGGITGHLPTQEWAAQLGAIKPQTSAMAAAMKTLGVDMNRAVRNSGIEDTLASLSRNFGIAFESFPEIAIPRVALDQRSTLSRETLGMPGFQSLTALGLEAYPAQGAIAEMLARYESNLTGVGPAFAEALRQVKSHDRYEAPSEEDVEAGLFEFTEVVLNDLGQTKDPLTYAGLITLLMLVLSALSIVVPYHISNVEAARDRAWRAEDSRAAAVAADLVRQRDARIAHDRDTLRAVARGSWLREEPTRSGRPLRRLYTDDTVRVLARRPDWAQVESQGYAGGTFKGWVHRSNLKPVDF